MTLLETSSIRLAGSRLSLLFMDADHLGWTKQRFTVHTGGYPYRFECHAIKSLRLIRPFPPGKGMLAERGPGFLPKELKAPAASRLAPTAYRRSLSGREEERGKRKSPVHPTCLPWPNRKPDWPV